MEEDVNKEVRNLDWSTGFGVARPTFDLFGHLFKVAFSAQFFEAELDGSAEQQLFTVHALLLRFSWFRLLVLLQPLQRRFLSAGFSEWQDFVHCWVDLTRCPNRKEIKRGEKLEIISKTIPLIIAFVDYGGHSHCWRLIWLLHKWLKGWFGRWRGHNSVSDFKFLGHLKRQYSDVTVGPDVTL